MSDRMATRIAEDYAKSASNSWVDGKWRINSYGRAWAIMPEFPDVNVTIAREKMRGATGSLGLKGDGESSFFYIVEVTGFTIPKVLSLLVAEVKSKSYLNPNLARKIESLGVPNFQD